MLIGRYEGVVDQKGRVIVPAKLRDDMGESFIVTLSFLGHRCLYAYPMTEWKKVEAAISSLAKSKVQDVQRVIFSNAVEVCPDKQGRFIIPAHLRAKAGLDKDIFILGVSDRAEIWDAEELNATESRITEEKMGEIMMSLDY